MRVMLNLKFIVLSSVFVQVWLSSGTAIKYKSKFWKSSKQQEYSALQESMCKI